MCNRPNIVIVMTDQQRADLRRGCGYELDTMPFLDRWAEGGVDFARAYTPNPTCMPARVSMFTGRYSQSHRVRTNHNAEDALYTEDLLDVLKKEKVPAAFFVVGTYIEDNPDLIRRMEKEGHIVGNHTMSHPDMSSIADQDTFKKELEQVEALYKETTGKEMKKFYRPPQGKFSFHNLEQAKNLGYTTVFWSLAYVDWYTDQQPTREEALEKLIPRTHNGAVILLHSTSKTNARILQELITKWKEEGYQFASLEKLGM